MRNYNPETDYRVKSDLSLYNQFKMIIAAFWIHYILFDEWYKTFIEDRINETFKRYFLFTVLTGQAIFLCYFAYYAYSNTELIKEPYYILFTFSPSIIMGLIAVIPCALLGVILFPFIFLHNVMLFIDLYAYKTFHIRIINTITYPYYLLKGTIYRKLTGTELYYEEEVAYKLDNFYDVEDNNILYNSYKSDYWYVLDDNTKMYKKLPYGKHEYIFTSN